MGVNCSKVTGKNVSTDQQDRHTELVNEFIETENNMQLEVTFKEKREEKEHNRISVNGA